MTEDKPLSKKRIIVRIIEVENNKDIKLLQNIELPFTENYKEIIIKWLKGEK